MHTSTGNEQRVYHSRVDRSGRIVLPADVRSRHRIRTGDQVVILENDEGLQVKTQKQAIQEAQAFFALLAPPEVQLSEELIRERREEAKRE